MSQEFIQFTQFLREIAMPSSFSTKEGWMIKIEDQVAMVAVPANTYEEICRNDLIAGYFDSHYITLGENSFFMIYHYQLNIRSRWLQ